MEAGRHVADAWVPVISNGVMFRVSPIDAGYRHSPIG